MNRQQAKELLPIIQAFAEGKTIQFKWPNGAWIDLEDRDVINSATLVNMPQDYRIKQEPKYRPFANKEECWQEMLKHQPFGWTKSMTNKNLNSIVEVINSGCVFTYGPVVSFDDVYKFNTFADGAPFGIKEE